MMIEHFIHQNDYMALFFIALCAVRVVLLMIALGDA